MYFLPSPAAAMLQECDSARETATKKPARSAGKISLILCNSYGNQFSTIALGKAFYWFIVDELSGLSED